MQLYWISTHFQLFITDFAKIISYLSGSRNSQFQGTPLKGCFWNNSSTRVVKIWKWLQNLSVEQFGVAFRKLLEKITKCSGTKRLWGSCSLVKLHAVHLEKNFTIYFFLENFKKCPEKKQNLSEKLLTGLVSMNIFTDTF